MTANLDISNDLDIDKINIQFEELSAQERFAYANENFMDKLILSTSFGIQSAVMLHLASQTNPDIPIIFIDTGYLFKETYEFANQLKNRLNLNLKIYAPNLSAAYQETIYGKLWEQGEEGYKKYGLINKVEPMNRALKESNASAWMTGLRRQQSHSRKELQFVVKQNKTLKIHPILDWTSKDVYEYLQANDLPYHPLWESGYASVGDWHSSRPLSADMTEEESRNNGVKRECGLHELSNHSNYQI